jgi:hypothetical protein
MFTGDMCPVQQEQGPWVPSHCGIHGNGDADALARKGSSNPFTGREPAIPISPSVGRLKIKKWLNKMDSE